MQSERPVNCGGSIRGQNHCEPVSRTNAGGDSMHMCLQYCLFALAQCKQHHYWTVLTGRLTRASLGPTKGLQISFPHSDSSVCQGHFVKVNGQNSSKLVRKPLKSATQPTRMTPVFLIIEPSGYKARAACLSSESSIRILLRQRWRQRIVENGNVISGGLEIKKKKPFLKPIPLEFAWGKLRNTL